MKRPSFLSILYISIGLAVLFQFDLLCGQLRLGEDLLSYHYPLQLALQAGEVFYSPFVGPSLNLFAEGQCGPLSPFNWVIRLFPMALGFAIVTILLQFMSFFGMGLLLRQRGLSLPACMVGMLAYGGSLCFLLRVEHWHYFQIISLIPLTLYGQERQGGKGFFISTLFMSCALLAGGIQFFLIFILLYCINAFLQARVNLLQIALALILCLGISFPFLLEHYAFISESERSFGTSSGQHSLPWMHVASLFLPLPFGAPALDHYLGGGPHWEYTLFPGSIALFLFLKRAPGKYLVTCFVILVMMLGEQIPVVSEIYHIKPFYYFRAPSRLGIVLIFFVACGAAHGLDLSFKSSRFAIFAKRLLQMMLFVFLILLFFSGVLFDQVWEQLSEHFGKLVTHSLHSENYFYTHAKWISCFLLIQLIFFCIYWLLTPWLWKWKKYFLIVLLLFFETITASHLSRATVDDERMMDMSFPKEVKGMVLISPEDRQKHYLKVSESNESWQQKIVAKNPFIPSMLVRTQVQDALHHSPLRSRYEKRWQRLLKEHADNPILLKRAGVHWRYDQGHWVALDQDPGVLFYPGQRRETSVLIESRLLNEPLEMSLHFYDHHLFSTARQLDYRLELGSLVIDLPDHVERGWLRTSITWHPNWSVRVDGVEVDAEMVDLVYTAIPIKESNKKVEITLTSYQNKYAHVVSYSSLFILLFIGVFVFNKRKIEAN